MNQEAQDIALQELNTWYVENKAEVREVIDGEGSSADKAGTLLAMYNRSLPSEVQLGDELSDARDAFLFQTLTQTVADLTEEREDPAVQQESTTPTAPAASAAPATESANPAGTGGGLGMSVKAPSLKGGLNGLQRFGDAIGDKLNKEGDIMDNMRMMHKASFKLKYAINSYNNGEGSKGRIHELMEDLECFGEKAYDNSASAKSRRKSMDPEEKDAMQTMSDRIQENLNDSKKKMSENPELESDFSERMKEIHTKIIDAFKAIGLVIRRVIGALCFRRGRGRAQQPVAA